MSAPAIRVLLVEDSPSDADVLRQTLDQAGLGRFEIAWSERLGDALARLGEESFDVLLLDLSLPDSSGPDTFRRARKAAPGLPIVVLTGSHDDDVGLAAVREGVQDYLIKGESDRRQIVRAIRYAIERKQAEEALVRSKEEWERTFDSVPDLIALLDTQHRIVRMNRAMAQRLGVVGSQAVGLHCFACVHGTDGPPGSCPHSLTLVDGLEHVAEVREDKIGGDFLVSTTPLRDELGRLTGSVHVARDITQRKRTEERVRHQNAVLEGINSILSKALTCDSEEQLGHACLEVVEEVTESSIGFLDEVNAEGGLDTIAINAPCWGTGQMPGSSQRVGVMGLKVAGIYGRVVLDGHGLFTNDPRRHPDSIGLPEGHPLLHAFLGAPLKHDGKTIGMIGVGNRAGGYRPQDLEALEALALPVVRVFMWKRAERAVRAGEERLRQAQKMESIGILAGGVAHDFNNLLVGVVGNASLAKEMLPPDNPIVELLEGVMKTGEQAAHLTRQMLAYAGKGALVVERLRLSALIPEMNRLVRPLISKKIALRLDLDDDSPPIEADRGQIQQVFMNLALNAAEAMDGGEGLITVKTGVENVDERYIQSHPEAAELRPGEYAFLEVCDNGCGMDDATRARIFDPFFSTKFTGRGLGLAAVAGIVRSHKGAIAASSAPGQGSCFRVLFPAATRAAGEPADPAHTAPLQGSGVVLVVDDEPIVREMAKRALERHGYTVLAADSGLAAIDVLKRHPGGVALVILDLSMPHMDGEEALPELRKIRPGVKVVVSSGYSEAETMSLFEGQQVSGFIQKPYTSTGLAEKVKDAIG